MFEKSFCSSPWVHARLTYNGDLQECRWYKHDQPGQNVKDTSLLEFYNSDRMRALRTDLLDGKTPAGCQDCYYEDSFDKISGRTRQLMKSGIYNTDFPCTTRSSPHYKHFKFSQDHNGLADYHAVDLQIDLGNACNSACIMCDPFSSSQLQQEYKKLHKINHSLFQDPVDYRSWTRDPATLEKFIQELIAIPNLKYIHFLGGETLYDPAFYTICERLIDAGVAKNIIVGTTTNGTIYDQRVERLITQFKEYHLGVSIETVTPLNDYIRYPGKVDVILTNLEKFLALRDQAPLSISLRITPNIFTINELDQLCEYMIKHQVIAESCNILSEPECLRIELLPHDIRQRIVGKLDKIIEKYNLTKTTVGNIRRVDLVPEVIANLVLDYRHFVATYKKPGDADVHRTRLIKFLQAFEQSRGNSILDYAPDYENFLRHYGY